MNGQFTSCVYGDVCFVYPKNFDWLLLKVTAFDISQDLSKETKRIQCLQQTEFFIVSQHLDSHGVYQKTETKVGYSKRQKWGILVAILS